VTGQAGRGGLAARQARYFQWYQKDHGVTVLPITEVCSTHLAPVFMKALMKLNRHAMETHKHVLSAVLF